jgi:hypothetical protein
MSQKILVVQVVTSLTARVRIPARAGIFLFADMSRLSAPTSLLQRDTGGFIP